MKREECDSGQKIRQHLGGEKADGLLITHLTEQKYLNLSLQGTGQEEVTQFKVQNTRKPPTISEGVDKKGLSKSVHSEP